MNTNKNLRLVFMGTTEFAVGSLKTLIESGYTVVGVITIPDKFIGKHQSKLQPSPIKKYALAQNLPLLQPDKLKDPQFLAQLREWNPDLQIVVAFRMLPEEVWSLPRLGSVNLHASFLPQYRGAAPIQWAIINGETETGITTFFLTHEIDAGQIIFREKLPISEADTAETLHDRLCLLGARLLERTIDAIAENNVQTISQDMETAGIELKPAPKITKETGCIRWDQPVKTIYDLIRGLAPSPGAWTDLKTPSGKAIHLKIYETRKIIQPHDLPPGTIRSDGRTYFDIAASDGFLRLLCLQQRGKIKMSVADFLCGFKL
jgi:methionyl-tRNA formyltransferase